MTGTILVPLASARTDVTHHPEPRPNRLTDGRNSLPMEILPPDAVTAVAGMARHPERRERATVRPTSVRLREPLLNPPNSTTLAPMRLGHPTTPATVITITQPSGAHTTSEHASVAVAPRRNPTITAIHAPQIAQGKRRKLMDPEPWIRFHPFVATLEAWVDGVPVDCGPPWTDVAQQAAVTRGPHTSALTPDARQLISDEMDYQVAAGFSEIKPWAEVQALNPTPLKVSPLAVIPQVGRRGRLLLDLSFAAQAPRGQGKRARRQYVATPPPPLAPSVNDTTTKQSPEYPVKELGRVLPRLLHFMATVPPEETIMFSKIDLADGSWRMLVAEETIWNFAYTLPGTDTGPASLVIPHALQMGWTESPGYFCATTETGRDIMQALVDGGDRLPPARTRPFYGAQYPCAPPD